MSKKKICELVHDMVLQVIEGTDLELVDVEFAKECGRWYLRIFIDRPGGVSHRECQFVSEYLSNALDEKDPIPHSYVLEVSSPGIERPLKKLDDYRRFTGRLANIVFYAPVCGKKKLCGRIAGVEGDNVILDVEGEKLCFTLSQIASAKLEADFKF